MFVKKVILFQSIKRGKQLIKNYQPVSLLSICGKLLESSAFNFIDTRNMLSVPVKAPIRILSQ